MPLYDFVCRLGHATEERQGVDITSIPCPLCGETAYRQAAYKGIQIINATGDIGRPVTWEERRQREQNAYTMERVTNNSKRIAKETGEKLGPGLERSD